MAPPAKAAVAPAAKLPGKAPDEVPASRAATSAAAPAKRAVRAASLPVRPGEEPWTAADLRGVRAELTADVARLREEIDVARVERESLVRDYGDGSGEDQADAGAKTFEREHEMSLAANAEDMLYQGERALARLADGTYGQCEACAEAVGKARLQAFPRATLCVALQAARGTPLTHTQGRSAGSLAESSAGSSAGSTAHVRATVRGVRNRHEILGG